MLDLELQIPLHVLELDALTHVPSSDQNDMSCFSISFLRRQCVCVCVCVCEIYFGLCVKQQCTENKDILELKSLSKYSHNSVHT